VKTLGAFGNESTVQKMSVQSKFYTGIQVADNIVDNECDETAGRHHGQNFASKFEISVEVVGV
jgi:hypothetical protein